MRIVCISDTHMQLDKVVVPDGDVLLHAGDLTYRGTIREMASELYALGRIGKRFKRVVVICGNHDWLGEKDPAFMRGLAEDNGLTWLQDELAEVEGLKVYGSAFTPEYCEWAFNLDRYDGSLEEAWARIPNGVDILLTHGPAYGNLDDSYDGHLGCRALKDAIERVKPKIHIFGHIHHAYGRKVGVDGITYVNASSCDEEYRPVNPPVVVDWPLTGPL